VDEQTLLWYRARQFLVPLDGFSNAMLRQGLDCVERCSHPDALWMRSVFERYKGPPSTRREAKRMFQQEGDDTRALVMAGLIHTLDWELVNRAADKGNAFAQGWMCNKTEGEEEFRWASLSAAQDDPEGLSALAWCYSYGQGVASDEERAMVCRKRAAQLGHPIAQEMLADSIPENQAEHFLWLGKAAPFYNVARDCFCNEMCEQMRLYCARAADADVGAVAPAIFQIGESLVGQVEPDRDTVFGKQVSIDVMGNAQLALEMWRTWCKPTRDAMDCWVVCAIRKTIPPDVRLMVSGLIWARRREGLYLLGRDGKPIGSRKIKKAK
jgi:hypothetical protein